MALIDDIKVSLRVTSIEFNTEITDLINAARVDLALAGIDQTKTNDDSDPLIKRAITVYCKAFFGYDNPDADRFAKCYEMLKQHLALASDYNLLPDPFAGTEGV
jgi:hypothetical protein